ncbi:MAG: NADH:flavin oxidoreductase/NADH oxidase [Herbinix sp.]|jgi:2-enoate reductase|nr:NADH:flavin oxidoreductase/NADH oxidase [Herbinix sp.]
MYQNELKQLPLNVNTSTEVTPGQLKEMKADVIILATGSTPVMPNVPGINDAKVLGCMDAFAHPEKVGQKVVVVGGGLVGCEMALDYAQDGKEVTVVEALPQILSAGIPSPIPNGQMIPDLFEHYKVRVLENHKLASIQDGKLILESEGREKALDADSIVIAVGFRPMPSLAEELSGCGAVVYEIGDGQKISTILHAIWEGYEIGNNI